MAEEQAVRGWICSICAVTNVIEKDPCDCGHPREPYDEIIENLIRNPDEYLGEPGVVDDGDDEVEIIDEQPEGGYIAVEDPNVVSNLQVEGEERAVESTDDDWGDDDDDEDADDWGDLEDPDAPPSIERQQEEAEKRRAQEPEGPQGAGKGWLCAFCQTENSIMDLECISCKHVRNMREDGDDVILLRPEVTAGLRPNIIPDEKQREDMHEVWACPVCTSYNDHVVGAAFACWQCGHVVDTTISGVVSFWITDAEYKDVMAARAAQEANERRRNERNNGGGGSGGPAAAAAPSAFVNRSGRKNGSGSNYSSRPHGAVGSSHHVKFDNVARDDSFAYVPALVRQNVQPHDYPSRSDPSFKDPNRLGEIFGLPEQLSCARLESQDSWRAKGAVVYPCMRIQAILDDILPADGQNGVRGRGMAVNSQGLLAILSQTRLGIYRPQHSSFALVAEIDFPYNTVNEPHLARVRFNENIIYVFVNHMIHRFEVNVPESTIIPLEPFGDDYMKEQQFIDFDIQDGHIVTIWKKWAGLYHKNDFQWFHAVSTSIPALQPRAVAFKNSYLHASIGTCMIAFHVASRNPAVLWVFGNLPKNSQDIPFCVSSKYGVFSIVYNQLIQSFYRAQTAQSVFNEVCITPTGAKVTPRGTPFDRSRQIVHPRLGLGENLFQNVTVMEYDESFGIHGRLLCLNETTGVIFMVLSRSEFEGLESTFRTVFGAKKPEPAQEEVRSEGKFHFLDVDAIANLAVDNVVDFRRSDGKFCNALVVARGGDDFILLKIINAEGGGEDDETVRVTNVSSHVGEFSIAGDVSQRIASRLLELNVGDEVEVNIDNSGWTVGIIEERMPLRSQVAVRLGNGQLKWTHLDFINEIRMKRVAEAIADPSASTAGEESRVNLADGMRRAETTILEDLMGQYSGQYSEPVVKFYLKEVLGLDVAMTSEGIRVSRQ